jgi:hypothetical protein
LKAAGSRQWRMGGVSSLRRHGGGDNLLDYKLARFSEQLSRGAPRKRPKVAAEGRTAK